MASSCDDNNEQENYTNFLKMQEKMIECEFLYAGQMPILLVATSWRAKRIFLPC